MTSVPDSWTELCLVSVMSNESVEKGTGEIAIAALSEDITGLDFGDKDIEVVPTLSGGRIVKQTPQGEETVTLKVYPVDVDLGGNGVAQLFHTQDTKNITQPILVKNTRNRIPYRLVLLWSTRLPSNATVIPGLGEPAIRIQIVNAWMTRYVPSYDGKTLTAEVTFKWTPFDKFGVENKIEESTNGTEIIPSTATASSTALTYVDIGAGMGKELSNIGL